MKLVPTLTLLTQLILTLSQPFRDRTPTIFRSPALKFGGAAVADLDGNGYPDLILGYHGSAPVEVYYNFNGAFTKATFAARGDMHAYVPFRAHPTDRAMHFSISRGGRKGNNPRIPMLFRINPATREILNVTDRSGNLRKGRGRSALYVDMTLDPSISVPDAIFTNADIEKCPACEGPQNHVFKNLGGGVFEERFVDGLSNTKNVEGFVTDIDGDGIMEIIMFSRGIAVYKIVAPLAVRDITKEVLPESALGAVPVKAVSELDYDNDGDFDLYIAIGKTGNRKALSRGTTGNDLLLENRGGVFVDVSESANIPKQTFSYGVTAADFDNDGFIDIFLTLYAEPDILLHNNGNGTFTIVRDVIPRPENTRGDMAQAVDYDADGRVDLIVSQGERGDEAFAGRYHLFKNFVQGAVRREGFVLVRVGSSPTARAVSLHALVTVSGNGLRWVRRVGSPGTAISSSYVELVHVGIWDVVRVDVVVRWGNGEVQTVSGVPRGSRIEVGTFGNLESGARGRRIGDRLGKGRNRRGRNRRGRIDPPPSNNPRIV